MTDSSSRVRCHANRLRWQQTTAAILCGTTLFTLPMIGSAQETADGSDSNEDYRLSPIIVNAQAYADDDANSIMAQELWVGGKVATSILDTPASVSVITEKEIEQRDANTTEDVLQYTPGVITEYYATDDRNDYFKIRGFQATTYRDGLTLGSMRGVREEPYAYERVEVLRGANSTLFGPADPGGSVNFVSKRPKFERFGEGYLSYGSFDRKEAGLDVGDTLNDSETLAYRFTGKIQDSDREYDHSEDDNEFLMGGLTWEPTDYTTATVMLDHLSRDSTPNSGGYPFDREYSRSEFFGEPDYNFHDVERTSMTGQLTHDFDNGLTLRGNLRYSDLTDDYGYVYLTDSVDRVGTVVNRGYLGSDSEAQELIGNAILQYDARFGEVDSSTLAGVEYRDASSEGTSVYAPGSSIDISNPVYSGAPSSLTVYNSEEQDYETRSVFVQQNLSFFDRFIVTGGLRNDALDLSSTDLLSDTTSSDDFSETSVRGALTYRVTDEVSTYVSMVESVAPPEVGVTPERGEQYEVGVKYAPFGMNALFSASVYELNKDDVTIAVVQDNGTIERENIGESQVHGLDLEAKAELTDNLSLTGGYSYMESEVKRGTLQDGTSLEGNEFTEAPKHTASIWTHYALPNQDMSVGLGARYTDAYYFDAANTSKSDAATLFDASFSYQLNQDTDLTVNVSNLLDEQHVVGSGTADFYNQGREVVAKVSYRW
ncbi:TonB-dependent siderophore receptor [Halomonas sp. HL-93]|uniref:TonB-dependent siderophore receptor n=1 Tax=Halomonas sp. HL-93 TaxID=1666906 RepID=UPI0006DB2647|nr:TonB-dependent siderophore receptor [Halomonas sp. HL-93]KPQ26446.1 MAG: TonB-depedent iron complex receptor [Halomonas sp. HL-93]SBR50823.1 iron complex outermembrane recepter protein [Halomonas sp. HL-93]